MKPITVLKVGGAELADAKQLQDFIKVALSTASRTHLIIVHGGGPEIAQTQKALGLEPQFTEGLRITDDASLRVAEMTLSGLINKRLSGALTVAGQPAIGISGVDASLLVAEQLKPEGKSIGWVGQIKAVNTKLLHQLLSLGLLPVISPISMDETGQHYNVNADSAAVAIAQELNAEELVFLTNVPGVLENKKLLKVLNPSDVEKGITAGTITGGMIPKTRAAVQATLGGATVVRITNLAGLANDSGTRITAE